jgi:hypothetical protein
MQSFIPFVILIFRKKDGDIIGLRFQLRPNMVVAAKKRSAIGTRILTTSIYRRKVSRRYRLRYDFEYKKGGSSK